MEKKSKYILVETDGYSISVQEFGCCADAEKEMKRAYHDVPESSNEEFREMSYFAEEEAIKYTSETVYVWKIQEVSF